MSPSPAAPSSLVLDGTPATRAELVRDLLAHLPVLKVLARSDFQVRYKRASFGVVWAVAVPLLQAAILAVVFSRVIRTLPHNTDFGVYVLAGTMAWSYFAGTVGSASTAIVDGSGLTDKVWFPRALLPMVPAASGLVGLVVSLVAVLVAMPLLGVGFGVRLLLLVPAALLLVAFSTALGLALAALHVYFRDVRFLVQAALLVLFYVTPVVYPLRLTGHLRPFIMANPLTGIVLLFHAATVGTAGDPLLVPVAVSVAVTVALLVVTVETYRHHDRLFVDLL